MNELDELLAGQHARISGPPWILGHRGSPLEAPENTLTSLRRAIDVGLDGFEYDLRACQNGELVLLHDETLERTSDGHGLLAIRSSKELAQLDAGGWFGARFKGEPLAFFEEALEIDGTVERGLPQHMIELKERGLVDEVARLLRELGPKLSVRIASFLRDVCVEARDAGLPSMLLADTASERDHRFVHDEGLAAYGTGPGGWDNAAGRLVWECERWAWSVDRPADLLAACRAPLHAFNTNEPLRALATRALVFLTPEDDGPYPIEAPELELSPGTRAASAEGHGDWFGAWSTRARVRNPFPFRTQLTVGVIPRRGAFEIDGLPQSFALAPGAARELEFEITGGSWRPGGDPLLFALYTWRTGPGRPMGRLLLDAPLVRVRVALADPIARRLTMLREAPGEVPASMTLRRERRALLCSIENAGGVEDARTIVQLDGRFHYGGRGVRVLLPADFDQRPNGVAFSCGFSGRRNGERVVRRWAGGVPEELDAGEPGRVLPLQNA